MNVWIEHHPHGDGLWHYFFRDEPVGSVGFKSRAECRAALIDEVRRRLEAAVALSLEADMIPVSDPSKPQLHLV